MEAIPGAGQVPAPTKGTGNGGRSAPRPVCRLRGVVPGQSCAVQLFEQLGERRRPFDAAVTFGQREPNGDAFRHVEGDLGAAPVLDRGFEHRRRFVSAFDSMREGSQPVG